MSQSFQPLKRQARALSFVGCLIRFTIIGSILFAIGTVSYIAAVGLVWPWDTETGKAFIDDIKKRAGISTPASTAPDSADSAENSAENSADNSLNTPPNSAHSDALSDRLADLAGELKSATAEHDRLERKVKSAKSFITDAETRVARADAEWNTANANYNARANGAIQNRGNSVALARIQQDIDRAARHQDEAKDYYDEKKKALDDAQKALDASNQKLDQLKAERTRMRKDAESLQKN